MILGHDPATLQLVLATVVMILGFSVMASSGFMKHVGNDILEIYLDLYRWLRQRPISLFHRSRSFRSPKVEGNPMALFQHKRNRTVDEVLEEHRRRRHHHPEHRPAPAREVVLIVEEVLDISWQPDSPFTPAPAPCTTVVQFTPGVPQALNPGSASVNFTIGAPSSRPLP